MRTKFSSQEKEEYAKIVAPMKVQGMRNKDIITEMWRLLGLHFEPDQMTELIGLAEDRGYIKTRLAMSDGDIANVKAVRDDKDRLKKALGVREVHVVPDELYASVSARIVARMVREAQYRPFAPSGISEDLTVGLAYGANLRDCVAEMPTALAEIDEHEDMQEARRVRRSRALRFLAARGDLVSRPMGDTSSNSITHAMHSVFFPMDSGSPPAMASSASSPTLLLGIPAVLPQVVRQGAGFDRKLSVDDVEDVLRTVYRCLSPHAFGKSVHELRPLNGLLTSCGSTQQITNEITLTMLTDAGADLTLLENAVAGDIAGCLLEKKEVITQQQSELVARWSARLIGLSLETIRNCHERGEHGDLGVVLIVRQPVRAEVVLAACHHKLVTRLIITNSVAHRIDSLIGQST